MKKKGEAVYIGKQNAHNGLKKFGIYKYEIKLIEVRIDHGLDHIEPPAINYSFAGSVAGPISNITQANQIRNASIQSGNISNTTTSTTIGFGDQYLPFDLKLRRFTLKHFKEQFVIKDQDDKEKEP